MNNLTEIFSHISKLFQWWVIIMPWEQGIRVRFGDKRKLLMPGTYFKIPFFDAVFSQTIRLRIVALSPQTVSTKDEKTLTLSAICGYRITDLNVMYDSLHHPESTICNIVASEISEFISKRNLCDISPSSISNHIESKLRETKYGIEFETMKISSYAVVRTYRIIQDHQWMPSDTDMNVKK
jgi:regulator of protease activity HflC (stomatin/prohibitin superfamily)